MGRATARGRAPTARGALAPAQGIKGAGHAVKARRESVLQNQHWAPGTVFQDRRGTRIASASDLAAVGLRNTILRHGLRALPLLNPHPKAELLPGEGGSAKGHGQQALCPGARRGAESRPR